jgi:hypothetical protein
MAKRTTRNKSTRRLPTSGKGMETSAVAEAGRKVDLMVEYRYVIDDLKRIGVIAGILIAALVILSFFLK